MENIKDIERIDRLERQVNDLYTAIGALKTMSEINHAQIQRILSIMEKQSKLD